jgi:cobalt transporter subunit CbtA
MKNFRKIVFVSALAGLIAGVVVTVAHYFGTASVILKAEVYENAAETTAAGSTDAQAGAADHHGAASWEPEGGFERTAYTALADILTGIGFALLLVSAYAIRGGEVNWRTGLYWGLAGFATFTLAPGLGLPAAIPGTEEAPLLDRQIWWVATVAATGAGLALMFIPRKALWALAGIVLIVLPHLWGAPQPAEYGGLAPESLMHEFVVAVVVTSLLFWLVLGSLTGFLYKRIG